MSLTEEPPCPRGKSHVDPVVQLDLIPQLAAEAPVVDEALLDADFQIRRRDADALRHMLEEHPDELSLGFHRVPFDHRDRDDRVGVGPTLRVEQSSGSMWKKRCARLSRGNRNASTTQS